MDMHTVEVMRAYGILCIVDRSDMKQVVDQEKEYANRQSLLI